MKAVVLAGGGGTRLWPLSTPEIPKQFQKLVSEHTMLEETLDRLDFLKPEDIYLAIQKEHRTLARALAPHVPEENFIIEPALRDTASCIGLAATVIEHRHPGEVMAVIYADHLIAHKEEFQKKLALAAELATKQHTLTIIEVEAKTPHTGYGYVELGAQLETTMDTEIYALKGFHEKPDRATAEQYLAAGNYLWNTGIYVWEARTLLKWYEIHAPETARILKEIQTALSTPEEEATILRLYPTLEKISIDYAIMEKVDPREVRIIKADLGWSDIGNFEALWAEKASSPHDNVTRGETALLECEGCLIYADNNKRIAAIGLKDTIIVDTPQGLLVTKKSESARLKEL